MNFEKLVNQSIKELLLANGDLSLREKKFNETIKEHFENVIKDINNSLVDFSKYEIFYIDQGGKKRKVAHYPDVFSTENILSHVIKKILDQVFKIKYPNRNKTIKALFGVLSAVETMEDFTIIKFDFKDYFNSVSSKYVFDRYIENTLQDRDDIDLLRKYCEETKITFAGLCTSNAIAEIIAIKFDKLMKSELSNYGLIFYERYIDDTVAILNQNVEDIIIEKIKSKCLNQVYYEGSDSRCTTQFNISKNKVINKRDIIQTSNMEFDYLGYLFRLSNNNKNNANDRIKVIYGITKEKQNKYENRLRKLIRYAFADSTLNNEEKTELLRQVVLAFSSRTVYLTKFYKGWTWKAKGFISNYGELRPLLKTDKIEPETENFLKDIVCDTVKAVLTYEPYFIKGNTDSGYSLYNNMLKNKTILLVETIGYDYDSLTKMCKKINIDTNLGNGENKPYNSLVKEYLIKIKVGY